MAMTTKVRAVTLRPRAATILRQMARDAALPLSDFMEERLPLLQDLPHGDAPVKQAAWDAFYKTIKSELPKNADGSHSGTYWVALMTGIQAYLNEARKPR